MNKQFRMFFASGLLCLMLAFSALAGNTPISNFTDGNTPISNVTDGNTPISNVTDPDQPGPADDSAYESARQMATDFLSFLLN